MPTGAWNVCLPAKIGSRGSGVKTTRMTLSRRFLLLGDYRLSGISGTLGVGPLAEAAMEVPCHASRLCSRIYESRATAADPASSSVGSVDATVLTRCGHLLGNACARYW